MFYSSRMNINYKIRTLIGIVFLAATLALSACNNGPAVLSFDTTGKQTGYISNTATGSSIEVIVSRPLINHPDLTSEDEAVLQAIDYSRYFVLIVTFGHGYYNQDNIVSISQFKAVIWVQTSLDESGTEGGSNYQIVKVPKDEMIHYGKITFRLLHNQMGEIARAVQTISAP